MEYVRRILVDVNELQRKVLDYIHSDKLDKMISNTIFSDNLEYKNAIIHGMIIASILTSKCELTCVKDNNKLNTSYNDRIEKNMMQMTAKGLREILDGMKDDAKIFCGLSEGSSIKKVISCESPSGDKGTWGFINLLHD